MALDPPSKGRPVVGFAARPRTAAGPAESGATEPEVSLPGRTCPTGGKDRRERVAAIETKEGIPVKRLFKGGLVASLALLAASLAMFVSSAWTGDTLLPAINLVQLFLVLIALPLALVLYRTVARGTIVRRLWGMVSVVMVIVLVAVVCELINGFAREWKVPQDVVLLVYLLVWLVLIAYPFMLYGAFRRTGLPINWQAAFKVLPGLLAMAAAALVVVLVPLVSSDLDAGTKTSNFVAIVVGLAAAFTSVTLTMTMGRGKAGRPWLFITLTFVSIVIQTIITTHATMVAGSMRVLEPANFFLHLCYALLIAGEYYQYELVAE